MAESFFATIAGEPLDRQRFAPQVEARLAVFVSIEGRCDPRRKHPSIGYLSPIEFERRHAGQEIGSSALVRPARGKET